MSVEDWIGDDLTDEEVDRIAFLVEWVSKGFGKCPPKEGLIEICKERGMSEKTIEKFKKKWGLK